MKHEWVWQAPSADLITRFGKVHVEVVDSIRCYVRTGHRKRGLLVGDERFYVDFYLIWDNAQGWHLDPFSYTFDGRDKVARADVRARIVCAVINEVVPWLASIPHKEIVRAEFLLFRHNKRCTLRSELPDLVGTLEYEPGLMELWAESRGLAGANEMVYGRIRQIAKTLRATIDQVDQLRRQVRATPFRPIAEEVRRHAA
jgi:hypothetical protein